MYIPHIHRQPLIKTTIPSKNLPHITTLYYEKLKDNYTFKYPLNTLDIGDKTILAQLYIQAWKLIIFFYQRVWNIQHIAQTNIYQNPIKDMV